MPFGKYRGVAVRHLPDAYLSWLGDALANDTRGSGTTWNWLLASVVAEMKHRGMHVNFDLPVEPTSARIFPVAARRSISFD